MNTIRPDTNPFVAVIYGDIEQVRKFLDEGKIDVNKESELLHWACWRGYNDIAELLIERGVNVNVPWIGGERATKEYDGFTPLDFAIIGMNVKLVKYLLMKGASAEQCFYSRNNGRDIYIFDPSDSSMEMFKLLILHGFRKK